MKHWNQEASEFYEASNSRTLRTMKLYRNADPTTESALTGYTYYKFRFFEGGTTRRILAILFCTITFQQIH